MENIFELFTGKYSLSKTLRFELKPVGKTLEKMREHFDYDKDIQTFLKDQRIEDEYQTLKPTVDKFHEEFITDSLQSQTAKDIDFSDYVRARKELIKDQKELKRIKKAKNKEDATAKELEKKINDASKEIDKLEKQYRANIGEIFTKTADNWKDEKYKSYGWKIGGKVASGAKILSSPDLLKLIGDVKRDDQKTQDALKEFAGFFTYLSGFNQNRANYYETGKKATTAVATRIVHENLPKFSDNAAIFAFREEEYLGVYDVLKKLGRDLVNRDKESLTPIAADIFQETAFNSCLSQAEIERYNQKIGNVNFLVNLYNQSKKDAQGFTKLTSFKTLYKQIGCGKRKPLFFELTHEKKAEAETERKKANDKEMFSVEEILALAKQAGEVYLKSPSKSHQIETVPDFLAYIREKEIFEGVYWSKEAVNTISNRYFADWTALKEKLKTAKVFSKPDKKSEEDVKIPQVIELETLFEVLDAVEDETWKNEGVFFKKSITEELKDEVKDQKNKERREIVAKAKNPSRALLEFVLGDIDEHAQSFVNSTAEVEKITQAYFLAEEKEQEDKRRQWKEAIKKWIDHACNANAMLKYFLVNESKVKGNPLDSSIANGLKSILFESKLKTDAPNGGDVIVNWFKWRDALRNFLTKKPQDDAKENKLKLNFENSALLAGWDRDLESQRKSIMLRDGKIYYLGILNKKHGSVFSEKSIPLIGNKEEHYEKMYFKQQTKVYRNLPRMGFPYKTDKSKPFISKGLDNFDRESFQERREKYGLTRELVEIKDAFDSFQGVKKKGDIFPKDKLEKFIAYYKRVIEVNYQGIFEIDSILKKNYSEINDLCKEFDRVAYELTFKPISKSYVDSLIEEGKMYLFEIFSKDFSDKSSGNKNLQSLYFLSLFNDSEKRNQLGANAQIFYRRQGVKEKRVKAGYEDKPWVIEYKRFTENKQLTSAADKDTEKKWERGKSFFFHFPVVLNANSIDGISNGNPNPQAVKSINNMVKEQFSSNANTYFLGIDRGEKNLAYYSLVDQNGNIEKQESLNLPFKDKDGNPRAVMAEKRSMGEDGKEKVEKVQCLDYNQLLEARAGDRDYARKNWQTIGTIKNLKEGYISQVVRTIADLAIQNGKPAYIVLELLGTGFKRSRQKIEKSVYQKFELALAKKLNFLVDKNVSLGEMRSVTRALQLTPPVNNYGDIENKKQSGIMLYTRPDYTSQTDPLTGWRKSIYLKKGSEEYIRDQILGNKKKKIPAAFSEICFDGTDYCLVYEAEYTGKKWKLYSGHNGKKLERFRAERNSNGKWVPESQDIVTILNNVFEKFDKNKSLLAQMKDGVELTKVKNEKYAKYTAWESLRFAIDLIQQIRNSGTAENDRRDSDFILSPTRNENGKFFDSREYWDKEQKKETCDMPSSGDANGAFNIARKGIIMNEHIKRGFDLYISDEEWDIWLAGREKWEEWVKKNMENP